jgi:hypothetical protein
MLALQGALARWPSAQEGHPRKIVSSMTDAEHRTLRVTGRFSYSREDGLDFTADPTVEDWELTKEALVELRDCVQARLDNAEKCPFHPKNGVGKNGRREI